MQCSPSVPWATLPCRPAYLLFKGSTLLQPLHPRNPQRKHPRKRNSGLGFLSAVALASWRMRVEKQHGTQGHLKGQACIFCSPKGGRDREISITDWTGARPLALMWMRGQERPCWVSCLVPAPGHSGKKTNLQKPCSFSCLWYKLSSNSWKRTMKKKWHISNFCTNINLSFSSIFHEFFWNGLLYVKLYEKLYTNAELWVKKNGFSLMY